MIDKTIAYWEEHIWQNHLEFRLEEEDCFLNCRMRIVNESPEVVPMYWWSNIAVPDYKKIPKSVDYFFDIPEEKPKYIANINEKGYGLLQMSTRRLRSRKLFSWGNGQASDHWQNFLTEKAGRYVEIQAGLGKTQYGCIPMAPHTAWEWMEQYGTVQLPSDAGEKSHAQREQMVTELMKKEERFETMEIMLRETKSMAKKPAVLVSPGSGYGAFRKKSRLTEHLEFRILTDSLKNWQKFFETGILHTPDTQNPPDEFLIEKTNLDFLVHTLETENKDNWYAYYQAGIGYYTEENYELAKKNLYKSWEIQENPWACHGMAYSCLMLEEKEKAINWMEKGLQSRMRDIAYWKDGMKMLFQCEAYGEITALYEKLDADMQNLGKLKFYYISALHKLGEEKKAYELLESNGGLVMEDIREGEESVAQLWKELHENLYGTEEPVPYRYDFKAF